MEKLSITIDVSKIDKKTITERRWMNKDGHEVISKDLKLDIVPVKEPKKIKEGDTWEMWKTHFVAIPQTKEEREKNIKSVIVGDAIMFKEKAESAEEEALAKHDAETEDTSNIPF
jgi:hypothetical protein